MDDMLKPFQPRPPERKLHLLRLQGRTALTQIEGWALIRLHDEGPFALNGPEKAAVLRARKKLGYAFKRAQEISIPKGMSERPSYLPTMYEEVVPAPKQKRRRPERRAPYDWVPE